METQELTPPVSDADHSRGPSSAVLTLVQYGDYECPFTSAFLWQADLLLKDFPGDFRFAFRHFPLASKHLFAMRAAEAAEAAGAQGRFWEMHGLLLRREYTLAWSGLRDAARALRLDLARFEEDMASHLFRAKVEADLQSGERSGVSSTPAYFINGFFYDGDDNYDEIARQIRERKEA